MVLSTPPSTWTIFDPLAVRLMPLVLGEARESWRCPTGGAEHTRSSLLMVLVDAALGLNFA